MAEELPLFFQALVWLNLYWYVFLGTWLRSSIVNNEVAFRVGGKEEIRYLLWIKTGPVTV